MPNSAPETKLRINLNLLHPKELQTRLGEKFIKWLVTYGRFIVIFVEIIVVSAFVARFKYDADLDQLKKDINADLPYIEEQATDEALIDQTQNKLALIDKTYLSYDRWQSTTLLLATLTPKSIVFIGLSLEDKDEKSVIFRVNGSTLSNTDLGIFLNNLRGQDTLSEINLTNIAFEDNQIVFTITGASSEL